MVEVLPRGYEWLESKLLKPQKLGSSEPIPLQLHTIKENYEPFLQLKTPPY